MLPLSAVIVTAPDQPAPSLESLAGKTGIVPFIVKAGTADQLHQRGQLLEALQLRCVVLFLFEDPAEASRFEKAIEHARAIDKRAKNAALENRGRRFSTTAVAEAAASAAVGAHPPLPPRLSPPRAS